MTTGPELYRPSPPLAKYIEYFGYWQRESGDPHQSRALPRGAATIIIDVGGRSDVDFFAADGQTRLNVPPAFIAGAGIRSYVTQIAAAETVMTVHFRPAGAVPFLGLPLGALEDTCVGLADLWGSAGTALREQLMAAPSAATRIAITEAFLLGRMDDAGPAGDPDVAAVLGLAEQNPSLRVAEVLEVTGLSSKRLTSRFRAQVGLAPKAYLRVRRLQAALRQLDGAAEGGTVLGAALAANLGYFDQPHFVREFRSFTAMTPTQYVQRRSWLPSHVQLAHAC